MGPFFRSKDAKRLDPTGWLFHPTIALRTHLDLGWGDTVIEAASPPSCLICPVYKTTLVLNETWTVLYCTERLSRRLAVLRPECLGNRLVLQSVGQSVSRCSDIFGYILRLVLGTIQFLNLWFLGFRTGPVNAREVSDICM